MTKSPYGSGDKYTIHIGTEEKLYLYGWVNTYRVENPAWAGIAYNDGSNEEVIVDAAAGGGYGWTFFQLELNIPSGIDTIYPILERDPNDSNPVYWCGLVLSRLPHSKKFNEITGWAAGASKLITDPNTGSITGWSFGDGSNVNSDFKINADKFTLEDSNGDDPFIEIDNINNIAKLKGEMVVGKIESNDKNTYFDLNNNQIKIDNSNGFILDSKAKGTHDNPNISGGYIKGVFIEFANYGIRTKFGYGTKTSILDYVNIYQKNENSKVCIYADFPIYSANYKNNDGSNTEENVYRLIDFGNNNKGILIPLGSWTGSNSVVIFGVNDTDKSANYNVDFYCGDDKIAGGIIVKASDVGSENIKLYVINNNIIELRNDGYYTYFSFKLGEYIDINNLSSANGGRIRLKFTPNSNNTISNMNTMLFSHTNV